MLAMRTSVSGMVQVVAVDATSASYLPYLYSGLVKVVLPAPEVPVPADKVKEKEKVNFPVCVVTRLMSRLQENCGDSRMKSLPDSSPKDTDPHDDVHLADTFMGSLEDFPPVSLEEVDVGRFISIQREDPEIEKLCVTAAENLEEEKVML
ncbi:hypothetical protein E2C01_048137 [Portunus trituberculatus]|uniref:Uncharacterized protein n=1 Tax=Portunus trituberculatus TaxID=210409 RepID=A0A5B7G9T3_PORTR|nr:hypothetical protein [Portunus trituberculatus]